MICYLCSTFCKPVDIPILKTFRRNNLQPESRRSIIFQNILKSKVRSLKMKFIIVIHSLKQYLISLPSHPPLKQQNNKSKMIMGI